MWGAGAECAGAGGAGGAIGGGGAGGGSGDTAAGENDAGASGDCAMEKMLGILRTAPNMVINQSITLSVHTSSSQSQHKLTPVHATTAAQL